MLRLDLVCIYSSPDRDRSVAVVDELRRGGIICILLPSAQVIGTWDVEVPARTAGEARVIASDLTVH